MKLSAKVLLLSAAISSATAFADTGALRVKIVDGNGNAVVGAMVDAHTSESLTGRKGVTDANGEVRLSGLDPSAKYVVAVHGDGYQAIKSQNVRVVSGKSFALSYALEASASGSSDVEEVMVLGRTMQLVDTTSATVGQHITLDLTESLPTGRSFQSYLQLTPGVKPSLGGNPASKSGVNYSDNTDAKGNTSGSSTDNMYYIDGVNITDNYNGKFGANFNSEIIQEQHVLTGGLPAEYEGGTGLVSRVITKSGSNEFHGSVNYYAQSDSLVADNDNLSSKAFSTFDTAFTLGGPIIKDKLWFYTSYQIKERDDDIVDPITGEALRSVKTENKLGFGKLTWQATDNDKIVASWFNDPTTISGTDLDEVPNNRDRAQEQGGDNYKFEYSHTWDDAILTLDYSSHEGELTSAAANQETRDDVAFLSGGTPTSTMLNAGGYGQNTVEFRNKEEFGITFEYFLDTEFGSHEFKAGYSVTENERLYNLVYTGDGAQYYSVGTGDSGATLGSYVNDAWIGELGLSEEDYGRMQTAMASSTDSAYYLGLLDADNSGDIDNAELAALTFNSTAGNPSGNINVSRINQTEAAPLAFKSEGQSFYIQDNWNFEKWTVNAGLRAEKWDHIASDGRDISFFDWEIAPRLSVVYDINGDGQSKVWAFAGRYYDPLRTDMAAFAGTMAGSVREEDIFVGDRWLTYRTRGGTNEQQAYFSPATKTPYTDEFLVGYSRALTDTMSAEVVYTQRVSKDIMEDYDLGLYADQEAAGDFYLPLSYFGYDEMPNSTYVIGTLEGGEREYKGLELTLRRHRSENWQMLASYTYNLAEGNSNSDGNADFQGDVLWLDPRSPNAWGDQPGNIEHLFKFAGSYTFDNGIEVGAVYNWNSGIRYSSTWSVYGRHLPDRVDTAYEFGGVDTRWLTDTAIGADVTPSYGTLDLRAKYTYELAGGYKAEFFLDIFNALNDQSVTRQMDLSAGDENYQYGDADRWVQPQRLYLGARMSF